MEFKNEAIVKILTELADVMELLGESPFRVRAFRTASRTIEGLSVSVVEKIQKDEPMRGIGEGVIRRTCAINDHSGPRAGLGALALGSEHSSGPNKHKNRRK